METSPVREFSSLRDPSGFVFYHDGSVFRALDRDSYSALLELSNSGLLAKLTENKQLVGTTLDIRSAEKVDLFKKTYPGIAHFIEHSRIETITVPAEWTRSMLCDAALLELDIERQLLETGLMLKDATAYNVQFKDTEPIHIDVSSIEKSATGLWPAYGQFCRMFLFPLLLSKSNALSPKAYFLTYINGMDLDETARAMGLWKAFHAGFMDIFLPFVLQSAVKKETSELRGMVERKSPPREALRANLSRLTRLIKKIRSAPAKRPSRWQNYRDEKLYTADEQRTKQEAVRRLLDQTQGTVVDLGSNTGEFTFLASGSGRRVIAVEADHDSLDTLYLEAKKRRLPVQCMWTDLLNPTPATGFRNQERDSFQNRIHGQTVMALALIHHLIAASNFPLEEIATMLFSMTEKFLLVEYVSPKDSQFESLVGLRTNLYYGMTEDVFLKVFSREGEKIESVSITPTRSLHLFVKRR